METESQHLRTRIARSRRRLDRHARQLVVDAQDVFVVGRLAFSTFHRPAVRAAMAGLVVLARMIDGTTSESLRQLQLGDTLSAWLTRLGRQLRILAWRYRRANRARHAEVPRE